MTDKPSWRNRIADTITGGALTETSARIEQQDATLRQLRLNYIVLFGHYLEQCRVLDAVEKRLGQAVEDMHKSRREHDNDE